MPICCKTFCCSVCTKTLSPESLYSLPTILIATLKALSGRAHARRYYIMTIVQHSAIHGMILLLQTLPGYASLL